MRTQSFENLQTQQETKHHKKKTTKTKSQWYRISSFRHIVRHIGMIYMSEEIKVWKYNQQKRRVN